MPLVSRRRKPRIRFRTRLQIKEPGADRAIDARGLDLSQGGMGVRASGVCAVGSDVVCELQVDGEALSLPGVVAWATAPDAPEPVVNRQRRPTQGLFRLGNEMEGAGNGASTERPDTKTLVRLGGESALSEPQGDPGAVAPLDAAMGIRFETLVAEQAQVLEDLVRDGEPITSPLQVWFSGLAEPIAARAEASAEGIRLRTALPFLALDSEVRFRLGSDEEQYGRVVRVELSTDASHRVPRIEVAIAPEPETGEPREPGAAPPRSTQSVLPARASRQTPGARLLPGLAILALGAGIGAASTLIGLSPPVRHALAGLSQHSTALHRADRPAAAAPVTLAVPPQDPPAQQESVAQAETPPSAVLDIQPDRIPPTDGTEPAPTALAERQVPKGGSTTEPAALTATRVPPSEAAVTAPETGLSAPQVQVLGGATRIFIPAQGSDTDISRYELSSPGVVVNLPHAHARIPLLDYPIYRGIVRRLWLREHRDGVQVRIVWRPGPAHCKVVFDEHGITLTVRP
jgi:hypothetical protein